MFNYGPWSSHQCFNYERYNADFKGIRTNGRKGLERTLVKRMLNSIHRDDASNSIPPTDDSDLNSRIKKLYRGKDIHDNRAEYVETYLRLEIEDAENDKDFNILTFVSYSGNLNGEGYVAAYGFEQLPVHTIKSLKFKKKESKMKPSEYQQLINYYQLCFHDNFFNEKEIPPHADTNTYSIVFNKIVKFNYIQLLGQKYKSKEAIAKRGNVIHAYYKDPNDSEQEHRLRPAEIQYFFRHDVDLSNDDGDFSTFTFTFAYVRWFAIHPPASTITTFDSINSSAYSNTFIPDSELSILPVHCIHSPAGVYHNILEDYTVIIKFNRKIVDC